MSTTIRGHNGRVDVNQHGGGRDVSVTLSDPDGTYPNTTIVIRTDLLSAVAAECGVIMIDRADLPEVTVDGATVRSGTTQWPDLTLAHKHRVAIRRDALENLAMTEYLDAHPPVDEADVEALSVLVLATDDDYVKHIDATVDAKLIARRLLATGRVEVKR